jgi:hypothetical protein
MPERLVHPNSMAARKWRRTSWRSTLDAADRAPGASLVAGDAQRDIFRRAAAAARRGDTATASSLRAAAMRASQTSIHCG